MLVPDQGENFFFYGNMYFSEDGRFMFLRGYSESGIYSIYHVEIATGDLGVLEGTSSDSRIGTLYYQKNTGDFYFGLSHSEVDLGILVRYVGITGKIQIISQSNYSLGDVLSYKILKDNRTVIYYGDQDLKDKWELYSVDIHTHEITKLNQPMEEFGDVHANYTLSPNEKYIAYIVDEYWNNQFNDLYTLNRDTNRITKINDDLTTASDGHIPEGVKTFKISPNGEWLVYRVEEEVDDIYSLYKSPIHTSEPVLLLDGLRYSYDYEFSADSQYVFIKDRNNIYSFN